MKKLVARNGRGNLKLYRDGPKGIDAYFWLEDADKGVIEEGKIARSIMSLEYSSIKGVETITYSKGKGSFQFSGYDKINEVRQKHREIPEQFEGSNVLRLEYKIVRRRGIKAKFHRDLTAYDLFNPEVYRKLQSLFLEAYQAISKFRRRFYIDPSKNVTPKKWDEIQAEQFRHTCPKEHRYLLQSLRESGAISDKSFERIRATE